MKKWFLFFWSFCFFWGGASLNSEEKIELFVDYLWDAKGQDLFLAPESTKDSDLSLFQKLRAAVVSRGLDIQSFEVSRYRPYLLSMSSIHSAADLIDFGRYFFSKSTIFKENTKLWVFWSLGPKIRDLDLSKISKDKLVLFIWEPPVVQPESHDIKRHAEFHKILTFEDDRVDNQKYFKFYYPVLRSQITDSVLFEEKKFCTMINSRLTSKHPGELYSEREKVIRFFENKPGEFDLFGRGWEKRKFINYKGPVEDKIQTLKNYKFCICYENTKSCKGYITEKIFDCFAARVVPVYLGPENICVTIPKECFVDRRDFSNESDLYDFLKTMNEDTYKMYLEAAATFLQSETAEKFSEKSFVENFLKVLGI